MSREIRIYIVKLTPRRMGDEAELYVRMDSICTESVHTDSYSNDDIGHSDTQKLLVSSAMLFEIGNIGVNSLPYELSREQYDTLEYDAKLWEVVKKGLDLLSFGDNTRRQLETKLRSRGFPQELCGEACDYLASKGLINEGRILERDVSQLANKLYGRQRIKQELVRKGISREIIGDNLEELLDAVDFDGNLRKLVRRKCDFSLIGDRSYRESFIASMYRMGYSPSDTRAAIKAVAEESGES